MRLETLVRQFVPVMVGAVILLGMGTTVHSQIDNEIETSLNKDILDAFYANPHTLSNCLDNTYGGYFTEFRYDWTNSNVNNEKMIVSQARHVLTASQASLFYPSDPLFRQIADQGYVFLRDKMRDQTYGGYYYTVNRDGTAKDTDKYVYGHAFVIYALAWYYKMTGNPEAKQLAVDCFNFLEQKAHDATYSGYTLWTDRQGTWKTTRESCEKDQNSSLHLLEAFSALYRVAPDVVNLDVRLNEMIHLFVRHIQTPTGFLQQSFRRDWTGEIGYPTTSYSEDNKWNHISYGHDLEVGYLLYDAAEALGKQNDDSIRTAIKTMVDYTLDNSGFTSSGVPNAGFWQNGTVTVSNNNRIWWIQAEALNTLIFMSRLYPADSHDYYGKFVTQWTYIKQHFLDPTYDGWYPEADSLYAKKGHTWFVAYHTGRAAMNAVSWLRGDVIAPTSPTSLLSPGKTSTSVSLQWTAATDNTAVSGYQIWRNGVSYPIGFTQGTTYTVASLSPNTPYTFTTKAFDFAGNISPASNPVNVTTDNQTQPAYIPGLLAEFFDYTSGLSVIPALAGVTPTVTRTDAQVNYASVDVAWTGLASGFADQFASRHTGYLYVATAGSYTLYLSSDDGSRLFLNGTRVINNDGLHGMTEVSYTATLTAGYHPLMVEFFEAGGGAGLTLYWQGPGITKQAVPASALFQSGTANTAPTIATVAAASPSPVTASTTALSVLGADDNGETNLVYTWATTGTPPASVTFSANGTNGAKSSTATFTKAGAYQFQVTVKDQGNLTATSTISVTVNQTATTITLTPATVSIAANGTQQFSASVNDQFGTPLGTQPTISWSVSNGGTISGSGLFTAGSTAGGPYTITATSGSLSKTAAVTVTAVNQTPTIATAASASPSPVTATTTALSVLGADDNGEVNLVYTWATTGTPPAAVTFSANGTNGAKASTATFTKAGAYQFQVTAKDQGNLTATSTVSVVVNQTLTSVSVTPASASVAAGATQQFTASARDQFAAALTTQPAFTWTLSAGGTISTAGLFTAGTTAGTYTVTAATGGKSGTASVSVTTTGLPSGWSTQNIGSVTPAGSATYSGSTYTVKGAGADIWGTADAFRYVYKSLTGNGTIIARVASQTNTNGWAKSGIMFREALTAGSKHIMLVATPGSGYAMQWRPTASGSSSNTGYGTGTAPIWLKLTRSGNIFTASRSTDGVTWVTAITQTVTMNSALYVGLCVTSHANGTLCTSTFDNVMVQ